MKTLGKYRFGSKGAATTKINALGEKHSHLIVHLGHPIETEATEDTEAVYSNDWLVDVLWDGEASGDWSSAFVYTASPQHSVGASGVQAQYMSKVQAAHPEWFLTEEEDV